MAQTTKATTTLAALVMYSLTFTNKFTLGRDALFADQTIGEGQSLVSEGEIFELGFFSPGKSRKRFSGIWYNTTPDVVWVANGNHPITNHSQGLLTVSRNGTLVLRAGESIIWSMWSLSTGRNIVASSTPVVRLLQSGNLVIINGTAASNNNYIWQRFDYPCDTRLPGMELVAKLGNEGRGDKYLTSWRSSDDPAPGDFSHRIENQGLPELVIYQGMVKVSRLGPWNGHARIKPPSCPKGDRFLKVDATLPDMLQFQLNTSLNSHEGHAQCSKNCSCTAYAPVHFTSSIYEGSGTTRCLLWFGDLIDIRKPLGAQPHKVDIYIRVPVSELESVKDLDKKLISILTALGVLIISCLIYWGIQRQRTLLLLPVFRPGKMLLKSEFSMILAVLVCSLTFLESSLAVDTLSANQTLPDGQTLISQGQIFEVGFFSPGNSKNRFLGIWYKATPDVVIWVANRNKPLADTQGSLTIIRNGTLVLMRGKSIIWSSNSSTVALNPVVQLLHTGNLVLIDKENETWNKYMWQSFDYPCDTRVPGAELVANLGNSEDKYLTSWRSSDDPSLGDFSYRIAYHYGLVEMIIFNGMGKRWRSGPWNGQSFSNLYLASPKDYEMLLKFNKDRISLSDNSSRITRLTLDTSGFLHRYIFNESKSSHTTRRFM